MSFAGSTYQENIHKYMFEEKPASEAFPFILMGILRQSQYVCIECVICWQWVLNWRVQIFMDYSVINLNLSTTTLWWCIKDYIRDREKHNKKSQHDFQVLMTLILWPQQYIIHSKIVLWIVFVSKTFSSSLRGVKILY